MRIHTRPTVARIPVGMGGSKSLGDFDWSQLAADITAGTTGTANIIKATETPYVIPGTNILYNPAGGAVGSPYGAGAVGATASFGATSMMPVLIGGVVVVVVLVLLMGKK